MKRAWSILLAVLLGAAVVGIGTGYFLHLANLDRRQLAEETQKAKEAADKARLEQQQTIEETNHKLQLANQEVDKAQTAIKTLEQERIYLAQAKPLAPPSASALRGWSSIVSTALGVSLRYPPESKVTTNDQLGLTIAASNTSGTLSQTADGPWFYLSGYDAQAEQQYAARIASSTQVTYFIHGRLLSGVRGDLKGTGKNSSLQAAVLKLLTNGSSTHLLWIQTPPKTSASGKKTSSLSSVGIEDVLSTLEFKD